MIRKRRWGRNKVPKRVLERRKEKRVAMVALNGYCVVRRSRRGFLGKFDKDGQVITFRSALELTFFRIFQEDDSIESWDYEPERIPYTHRGKAHKTIIDAIIRYKDGRTEYIEIKPSKKVGDELVRVKARAVIAHISNKPDTTFKFLTEEGYEESYQQALKDLRKR